MVLSRRVQIGLFLLAVLVIGSGVAIAIFLLQPTLVTIVPRPPIPIDGTENALVKHPITIETSVNGRCLSLAFGPGSFLETGDCGSLKFAGNWTLFPQTQTLVYSSANHVACMLAPTSDSETRVGSALPDTRACEGIILDESSGLISSSAGFFLGLQPGNVPVWLLDQEGATRWDIRVSSTGTVDKHRGCNCVQKNNAGFAR
jgi:hypothetical protein